MCGIAGFLSSSIGSSDEMNQLISAMAETMWRRGPDDQGVWVDEASGVAFGQRRLSIIDLSPGGHQPMVSASGRYVITFNGEIYNFAKLRKELESKQIPWRGTSDTEVLLEAIAEWGIADAVTRCNGMFAFAVWDRDESCLWLARDRFGEKPLYFGQIGDAFGFASELKPLFLLAHNRCADLDIDRESLAQLLEYQYIPAPRSIFQQISKLEPGHLVAIRNGCPEVPQAYWTLRECVETALANPFEGDEESAVDALEEQLRRTVASRMEADVPLGAFLSAGIDSSLLVSIAQQISSSPVKTFTIGFAGAPSNEAEEAACIANHLGTDHTELWVDEKHPLEVIPHLTDFYDEPFADASQIPTHLVSHLTRQRVTVSLSGDGGDEVFGGYVRYVWAERIHQRLKKIPLAIRRVVGRSICATPEVAWKSATDLLFRVIPERHRFKSPVEKIYKVGSLCQVDGLEAIYKDLTRSHWDTGKAVLGIGDRSPTQLPPPPAGLDEPPSQMMYWDLMGYLPGDILTKVDRASMSCSLESRAPYLDHELVELAWRFPLSMKIKGQNGKWIARELLARHVPRELLDRPKSGFETPLFQWLRGPLRDWAEELLSEKRLESDGYFDAPEIRRVWDDHQSERSRMHYELWSVLMFQQWQKNYKVYSRNIGSLR